MGEAQVIHDDEFDTSGSTPKTGFYSSGSGYYNPHTGTFLGGSGAPASVNPTSTSAEEPTAQATGPMQQQLTSTSTTPAGGPSDKSKTSSSVTPEGENSGFTPPVDSPEAPVCKLQLGDDLGYMPDIIWIDDSQELCGANNSSSGLGGIGERLGRGHWYINGNRMDSSVPDLNQGGNSYVALGDRLIDDNGNFSVTWINSKTEDADPATDMDTSDDGEQYDWVIRDENGKITACKEKDKVNKDGTKTVGNTTYYETDEDGNRIDKDQDGNVVEKGGKPTEITDNKKIAENWERICSSVALGNSNASFYDSKGNPTSGSLGMDVGGGRYVGFFVQVDKDENGKVTNKTTSVKEGRCGDFGWWPEEVGTGQFDNEEIGLMVSWLDDSANSGSWKGLVFRNADGNDGSTSIGLLGGKTGPYGGGKGIPFRWNKDRWDLRGLPDYLP